MSREGLKKFQNQERETKRKQFSAQKSRRTILARISRRSIAQNLRFPYSRKGTVFEDCTGTDRHGFRGGFMHRN